MPRFNKAYMVSYPNASKFEFIGSLAVIFTLSESKVSIGKRSKLATYMRYPKNVFRVPGKATSNNGTKTIICCASRSPQIIDKGAANKVFWMKLAHMIEDEIPQILLETLSTSS